MISYNSFAALSELNSSIYLLSPKPLPHAHSAESGSGAAIYINDTTLFEVTQEAVPLNLTCSDTFYLENSTCIPKCDSWEEYSYSTSAALQAVLIIASVLGSICGAAVIIGSILQYKTMWARYIHTYIDMLA